MNFLDSIPAILRIGVVFFLILFAIRKKVSLGNAFLGGAISLGIIFGLGPLSMIRSGFYSILDQKTLSLTIIVALILVLSHSMETAGQMKRLLNSFRGLVRHPGLNIIIFPALIGLLPMPGGAIFSAPMVKNMGENQRLEPAQLSFINYWYRHIWEYWWPLYPGVLLTTTLAEIDLWIYVLCLFPLTPVALISGSRALKGVMNIDVPENGGKRPKIGPFIRELSPILIVIIPGLGIGAILSVLFKDLNIAKEIGLIIALVASIIWVWNSNDLSSEQKHTLMFNKQVLKLMYMVLAILVFKGMLSDSNAVDKISRELIQLHIPLFSISIILPFIVGGIAGITIAYVGTAFPILISLIHTFGQTDLMLPYMMLAMAGGFAGVLCSPLHLCLLLSNEYFDTVLTAVYKYLWKPCTVLVVSGMIYFGIMRYFIMT